MASRIQFRNDTSSRWKQFNPVLATAEMGVETDTNKTKIGDGITGWVDLPYVNLGNPGVDGKDGRNGVAGKDGVDGKDGRDGRNGINGKDGKDGADGKKGPKGDKGEKGNNGKDGVAGKDGKDGRNGLDGKDGKDGSPGKKGKDGVNGLTPQLGVDYFMQPGPRGPKGRDGSGTGGSGGPDDTLLETCTMTYSVTGLVTRIDYASGQSKVFTYNVDDTCKKIVWTRLTDVVTKDFTYNVDGTISTVTVTIV
jgi:hypothetical protein